MPDLARIAGAAGVSNGANGKETSTLCFKQSASVALLAIAGSLSLLLGVELLLAMGRSQPHRRIGLCAENIKMLNITVSKNKKLSILEIIEVGTFEDALLEREHEELP